MTKDEAIRKLIYMYDVLDPTGYSSKKASEWLKSMSETRFRSFMKELLENPQKCLRIEIDSFNEKGYLKLPDIIKAAKKLDIPLEERVIMPYRSADPSKPMVTRTKVPILYIPIRRLQQLLSKKNSASADNDKVNSMTGQVTGDSKSAAINSSQTFSLVVTGHTGVLKEYLGPRADDEKSKQQMIRAIEKDGKVNLSDLDIDPNNKQSINTFKTFMYGAGLEVT